MLPTPIGPLHFGVAHLCGPPSGDWFQTFHPLGHLIGSHGHEISGCEQKLQIQSFDLGAKAQAKIEQTTWFELAMSFSHCLGLCLYATKRTPSQTWGCLQPGRKVVTYLQEPPSLAT